MYQITDVVKNLLIINIIIYFGVQSLDNHFNTVHYFTLYPIGNGFEPYQIATYMFNHSRSDFRHLLFNMFALFMIGPIVEQSIGSKRFLFLYITAGVVSGIAHLLFSNAAAVGASGAINGVVVCMALMYPNRKMIIFPIPIEIKAIVLLGLVLTYDLLGALGFIQSHIAHVAHLGGALTGAVLSYIWGLWNINK